MFCPNCGNQIPDGYAFCSYCGAQFDNSYVNQQPVYQPPAYQQPQYQQYQQPQYAQPKPAKNFNLLGRIAAGVLLVAIGVVAGIGLRSCVDHRSPAAEIPDHQEAQTDSDLTPTEEPEAMVTVYLPTRMEKTIDDGSNSLWVEEYTYDQYGNMVTLTQYKPDGTKYYTITMSYDDQGNMIHRRYQSDSGASVYAYEYDSLGRQICVNDNGKKAEVRYDEQGRMIYYREGEATSYREITYAADGSTARDSQYGDTGSLVEYTDVYYDDRGNIVSTWRYTAEGDLLYRTDYVFNEENLQTQLLCYAFCSADHVGTSYTYTYDDYGNRIREDYSGDYYSNDHVCVYIVEPVEVLQSAARRLGQFEN